MAKKYKGTINLGTPTLNVTRKTGKPKKVKNPLGTKKGYKRSKKTCHK